MWQLLQQNDANNDTEMCKENTPKKERDYSRQKCSGSTTGCYPVENEKRYAGVIRGNLVLEKNIMVLYVTSRRRYCRLQ